MAAIDTLLRRLGYAKLDEYGLILTPEGRILSTRPAVLDDGLGGKIVGWREGDLAAMELERWEPALPASRRAVADPKATLPPRPPVAARVISPVAVPAAPAPVKLPGVTPAPAPAPVVTAPPAVVSQAPAVVAKPTIVAPPVAAPAPVVAAAPQADEDEWEWEIAMARARAAAEWAEEAARAAVKPASPVVKPAAPVKSAPVKRPTTPLAVVAAPPKDPIRTDTWPKTEELHESWESSRPSKIERVARISDRPAAKPAVAQPPRATVIPVPVLPVASDPRTVRPSVSSMPRVAPRPPTRFPKATGQIDDTIRTQAVAPANDDRTKPGIALPPASTGKRVASKQR